MPVCPYGYYLANDGYCYYSGWNSWGRWVLAGLFLLFGIAVILLWVRRIRMRRNRPQQQVGGGAAPTPLQQIPPQYGHSAPYTPPYDNQYPPPPPPPAYGAKPDSGFNSYYTGNEEGVASPANVYSRDTRGPDYQPPTGPPPGKI